MMAREGMVAQGQHKPYWPSCESAPTAPTKRVTDLLLPALRYHVGPGCCQMLTSAKNHSQHFLDEQGHIFKMRKIPIPWFQEGE